MTAPSIGAVQEQAVVKPQVYASEYEIANKSES